MSAGLEGPTAFGFLRVGLRRTRCHARSRLARERPKVVLFLETNLARSLNGRRRYLMDKKTALEYLAGQAHRVTAKVVSIDLDAPISTTTELLERMSFQGLVERDKHDRPKEYLITPAGRERLAFLTARDAAETPPGAPHPDGNPGGPASGVAPANPGPDGAPSGEKLDALREDVCSRLDALREDVRDLLDAVAAKPSSAAPAPTGSPASRVKELLARAERLLAERRIARYPKVRDYYQACCDLDNAPMFSFRNPSRNRKVAELEKELPAQVIASVERLRKLEFRDGVVTVLTPQDKQEVARLREELGLPLEASAEVSGG